MELFYFTSADHAYSNIRDKRIKVSSYNRLNDPFDWLGLASSDRAVRGEIRKLQERLHRKGGLLCMSTSWQEPLMWGHYADSHKGICLGFKVKEKDWHRVKYRSARPTLKSCGVADINQLSNDNVLTILTTKSRNWSYESEFRRFIDWKDTEAINHLHFLPFSADMRLSKVVVGPLAISPKHELQQLLDSFPDEVKLLKARTAFNSYKVVKQRDKRLW